MHYRRLFDFRGAVKTNSCSIYDALGLNKRSLEKIFAKYDFVYRKGFKIKDKMLHTFDPYEHEVNLSETYHPLLYREYLNFKKNQVFYATSMFIMKKDDFFDFCNECIPLMMDLLKIPKEERMKTYMDWNKSNLGQDRWNKVYKKYIEHDCYYPRHIALIMEYIASFYFMNLMNKYNERALGVKELNTELHPEFIAFHRNKLIRTIIKVLCNKNQYYLFKKDPGSFFSDSESAFIKFLQRYYN